MTEFKEPVLVTSALPYANGDIHIGHLVEYIQTDVFVRFLRMMGKDVVYFCASDTHGTPIDVKASQLGVAPEELVARYNREHLDDFKGFHIHFDRFYTTHSEETRKHAVAIFEACKEKGLIEKREVELTYCEHDKRFLPDRYVRGTCPKCGAQDQYGDNCEVCGATYDPTDMKDASCVICGNPPVRRRSDHYFFLLEQCHRDLADWVSVPGHLHENTKNWIEATFLADKLRDWDISRDAPYFGFEIPGEKDKYFYVWMDAPVGYIGTTDKYCQETGKDFDRYWRNPNSTVIHFIGKDIAYFHILFWPAMLMNSGYHVPDLVQVHGFLTVNGEKMSKRTGTAVSARTYLKHLDPQYLRYYYAAKLGPTNADLDLNLEDFVNRVNAELVNKIANLASRSLSLINRRLDGKVGAIPEEARPLLDEMRARLDTIAAFYEAREFAKALREIVEIAEKANKYFQDSEPFKLVGDDPEKARGVCTAAVNMLKLIAGALKPVVPVMVAQIEESLGLDELTWADLAQDYENRTVGRFKRLISRMERKDVDAVIEETRKQAEAAGADAGSGGSSGETEKQYIDIDTFAAVDLRVARVVEAEEVEEARALIRLLVDLGDEKRQIFAGLKGHVDTEALVGKNVIVVANLAPRKMRFGTSEGMVIAASIKSGKKTEKVWPILADDEVPPGTRIS